MVDTEFAFVLAGDSTVPTSLLFDDKNLVKKSRHAFLTSSADAPSRSGEGTHCRSRVPVLVRILKHSLSLTDCSFDRRLSATVFWPNSNPTMSSKDTFRTLPKEGLLLGSKVPSGDDDVFSSALHVRQLWNLAASASSCFWSTCSCIQTGRGRTLTP
eukprot:scaffold18232_cov145-Skeletonema_menzelii.AAC.3